MGSCSSNQERIRSNYAVKKRIGRGTFSVVKKGVRLGDKEEFAIKIINKKMLDPRLLWVLKQEAKILSYICNPHVVKLEETYETPTKQYMVLQFLKGGNLLDYITKRAQFSEFDVSGIVRNIASGLDYLHKKGIAHRDLKLENLMFENDTDPSSIKLTDFGFASYFSPDEPMNIVCGSPIYIAPEVVSDKPYYSAVDMWGLGVILYIMLCGFPPFHDEDQKELLNSIRRGVVPYPDEFWASISADAKDLVSKLLVLDPKQRYTAEQVLQHPFIIDSTRVSAEPFDASYAERLSDWGYHDKLPPSL